MYLIRLQPNRMHFRIVHGEFGPVSNNFLPNMSSRIVRLIIGSIHESHTYRLVLQRTAWFRNHNQKHW